MADRPLSIDACIEQADTWAKRALEDGKSGRPDFVDVDVRMSQTFALLAIAKALKGRT